MISRPSCNKNTSLCYKQLITRVFPPFFLLSIFSQTSPSSELFRCFPVYLGWITGADCMVFMLPVLRPLNIISQLRQLGALYVLPAMHLSFTVGYFYTAKKGFMVACSDCCLPLLPRHLICQKRNCMSSSVLFHPNCTETPTVNLYFFFFCAGCTEINGKRQFYFHCQGPLQRCEYAPGGVVVKFTACKWGNFSIMCQH